MNIKEMNILSISGMLPYLSDKSACDKIVIHDCLESTNVTAKDMAMSGAGHGLIVIADSQTAGRGRYGRSFFSPPGHGIYMSLLLKKAPQDLCGVQTLITAFAAVSVCQAIEATTRKSPQIKWVNDILLDEKKICGILCENLEALKCIIVGIGVNFTTPKTGYPEEIAQSTGSVFRENEPDITRNRLAAEIINRLFDTVYKCDKQATLAEYKKRLIMLGKKVTVTEMHESYKATVIDINDTGGLIVKKETGELKILISGEISMKTSIS